MIVRRYQKITIVKSRKPEAKDLNEQLQWLGTSLGLFNLRDKDKSCFRIFIELLKSGKKKHPLTSDELATKLNLSRGTVIHHLHKLIDSGIVVHEKGKFLLRVENLEVLVNELQKDISKATENLKEIAKDIDKALGL
jgi:predicted transcriptional regulator